MRVFLEKPAVKYLQRLNEPEKSQIQAALKKLQNEPPLGDIKPLKGRKKFYRLRIGMFRAIFIIKNGCIIISNITPRGQAYTKKTRS